MAAITARKIIEKALREIRVLGVGQPVNSEVETDAFLDLNNMLESWSLIPLRVFVETEETETLTSGTSRYTVGPGGDFDTNRPLAIMDDAFIRSGTIDYPCRVLTQDVYRAQAVKATSARPRFLTYTPEFPLGKMSFWPEPNSSTDEVHYRARVLLDSFATLTTEVNFAPGYERAIIKNLAIEIAASKGKSVTVELLGVAGAALKAIEGQNAAPVEPTRLGDLTRLTGVRSHGNILSGPFN